MKQPRCLSHVCTAVAAVCASVALPAQNQASDSTARRASIQATPFGLDTTTGDATLVFGIEGPPGAAFATLLEFPTTLDQAFQIGGPTPGASPLCVQFGSPGLINVTTPGASGVLPASGQSLVNFSLINVNSSLLGLRTRMQTLIIDGLSSEGFATSNCADKVLTNVLSLGTGALVPFKTVTDSVASSQDYRDVERGDFDGDGDIDTLLLGPAGLITGVQETASGPFSMPSVFDLIAPFGTPPVPGIPNATAMELADVNNDNYLDLVVSLYSNDFVSVHLNLGRVIPVTTGPGGTQTFGQKLGAWRGFDATPQLMKWQRGPEFANLDVNNGLLVAEDIETADFDLDGDLDIVVAVSDDGVNGALRGAPNRIFTNMLIETGAPTFTETTVPDSSLPFAPSLFASTDLNDLIYDDSEDVEVGNLDGDARLDIAFANVIGPLAIQGFEWIHLNTAPVMTSREIVPNASVNDESLDLVLGDLNLDGIDDIYVGNWFDATGTGFSSTPVADRVYLSTGPGAWNDSSALLPDQAIPFLPGNEPRATSDVEMANVFTTRPSGVADPSPELIIGYGRRGSFFGTSGPVASGIRVLQFDGTRINSYVFPVFGPTRSVLLNDIDVGDIEMGDWNNAFFDLDFGLAIDNGNGVNSGFGSGHAIIRR